MLACYAASVIASSTLADGRPPWIEALEPLRFDCHREERSDLATPGQAHTSRDCFVEALLAITDAVAFLAPRAGGVMSRIANPPDNRLAIGVFKGARSADLTAQRNRLITKTDR